MTPADEWLLLAVQLPPAAASLRVRVWRRLQAIGAVPLGTSLYALPDREPCREDFEWLLRAVRDGGGDAVLVQGRLLAGLDARGLRERFAAARDAEYRELARTLRGRAKADADALARARRRFAEIEGRDYFGSDGRTVVAALLRDKEAAMPANKGSAARAAKRPNDLVGKTWVTRERVHVDRIACAWLVRRRIDPDARFRFVASRDAAARGGEIRFDMYEGEITHDGERCSFEVLLDRAGLREPALDAIAAIVHDIDLKDAKFGRPETAGVAAVLDGVCRGTTDDLERIERGGALFDDLYRRFGGKGA